MMNTKLSHTKKMLKKDFDIDVISVLTGLSITQIKELKNESFK